MSAADCGDADTCRPIRSVASDGNRSYLNSAHRYFNPQVSASHEAVCLQASTKGGREIARLVACSRAEKSSESRSVRPETLAKSPPLFRRAEQENLVVGVRTLFSNPMIRRTIRRGASKPILVATLRSARRPHWFTSKDSANRSGEISLVVPRRHLNVFAISPKSGYASVLR